MQCISCTTYVHPGDCDMLYLCGLTNIQDHRLAETALLMALQSAAHILRSTQQHPNHHIKPSAIPRPHNTYSTAPACPSSSPDQHLASAPEAKNKVLRPEQGLPRSLACLPAHVAGVRCAGMGACRATPMTVQPCFSKPAPLRRGAAENGARREFDVGVQVAAIPLTRRVYMCAVLCS